MICNRIRVKGRVQGVFFRVSTKEIADSLGIKGWVKNEPDRTVLIEAEGNSEEMREFIQWCHAGPPMSKVEAVEVSESAPQGHEGFRITY